MIASESSPAALRTTAGKSTAREWLIQKVVRCVRDGTGYQE